MSGQASESVRGVATDAHAGRPCPYCRFALKATVDIVQCGACGSIHHADCWDDNGGCSIMACPGGPGATNGTGQTAAIPPPPPVFAPPVAGTGTFAAPPTAAFPPPPTPGGGGSKRGGLILIAAIVLLAFAISGVAVALVLTKADPAPTGAAAGGGEQIDPTPEATVEATPDATVEPDPTIEPEPTPESALPADSRGQMRRDIQDMLRTWHENIVAGDPQAAWDMLTSRKQTQNERKYGFREWARGQATLAPHLDPSGTHVSIVDLNDKTGVATVKVTGMSWSKPGARCSEWSGITWVRYEDGAWKYDPGYSTTPQRESAWKNRFGQLLGGSC